MPHNDIDPTEFRRLWSVDVLKNYKSEETQAEKTRNALAQELIRAYEEIVVLKIQNYKYRTVLDSRRESIKIMSGFLSRAFTLIKKFGNNSECRDYVEDFAKYMTERFGKFREKPQGDKE